MYFLALFLTQMWEDKTMGIVDKVKLTLVYMGLVIMITCVYINKGHIITLFITYLFAIIGSITGYFSNYRNILKYQEQYQKQYTKS